MPFFKHARFIPCWFAWSLVFFNSVLAADPPYTLVVVKNVEELGPQHNPDVTGISRDGGSSVLLNGHIVWLFDDTECFNHDGKQLSFVSNTASYSLNPNGNISVVRDFGVVGAGTSEDGKKQYAIGADETVGTGGWVPFTRDELDFNQQKVGVRRVAIWPGTNPTPIGTDSAFVYAPLVYVDAKPEDPSKFYQSRGITLISISASSKGPSAGRVVDLLWPGGAIPYGGFAAVLGAPSLDTADSRAVGDRDVYAFGYTAPGLQLARIRLDDITKPDGYTFYHPNECRFKSTPPSSSITEPGQFYLTGSYASGSIFYSPYFRTFLFVYFNKFADSTFYIRYLDLDKPSCGSQIWIEGGRNGTGIGPDDAEALVWYEWSSPQTLWVSPPGKGGFNYAGFVHPEFFNRQYLSPSLYSNSVPASKRVNPWYGSKILPESAADGDGKNLLLSWTSQQKGGFGTGIYQVMLARLTFDTIPPNPTKPASTSTSTALASPTSTKTVALGIGDPNGSRSIQPLFSSPILKKLSYWAGLCHAMLLLGLSMLPW